MSDQVNKTTLAMAEKGYLPDKLLRLGIRQLLSQRLSSLISATYGTGDQYVREFVEQMAERPIADCTDEANDQHYELPTRFFEHVLGPQLKYSCALWPEGTESLADAEEDSLAETAARAQIQDGMDVLELGCGWGSLSLWMARHFPNARITAVSNSATQGDFIRQRATDAGLSNLRVITADMNDLVSGESEFNNRLIADGAFDRVVSVEMFEHMSNWPRAFETVSGWLRPEGKLFLHVFCHKTTPYLFADEGDDDWMARYFFSGGIMPSNDLAERVADRTAHLSLETQWRWDGTHYAKTCDAWLANMDTKKSEIMPIMTDVYGDDADIWWNRWRMFFMACSELFAWRRGDEWWVGHYLIGKDLDKAMKANDETEAA